MPSIFPRRRSRIYRSCVPGMQFSVGRGQNMFISPLSETLCFVYAYASCLTGGYYVPDEGKSLSSYSHVPRFLRESPRAVRRRRSNRLTTDSLAKQYRNVSFSKLVSCYEVFVITSARNITKWCIA